jgi:tetratricopeptide (TPR) repeat protein
VPGSHTLFVSFRRDQAEPVHRLAAALRAWGVNTVLDSGEDGDEGIPAALAEAEALLVWYSADYPAFRRGARLLAAAATAAEQREPGPARILVVNPCPGAEHIEPARLREACAPAPGLPGAPDFPQLAGLIRKHLGQLHGALGESCALAAPCWREAFATGHPPVPGFEGRARELWAIHDALWPTEPEVFGGRRGTVAMSGEDGIGKTWLAREYALRFGPAYPGGIFWLSATGARPAAHPAEWRENSVLQPQLAAFLSQLDEQARPVGLAVPELRARLGELLDLPGLPFLWIVDDLPEALTEADLRHWLAPATAGRWGATLLTGRGDSHGGKAVPLRLPPLDPAAALRLLTRTQEPIGPREQAAAETLANALDGHPLALRVAGAVAAETGNRKRAYQALLRQLKAPTKETAPAGERTEAPGAAAASAVRLGLGRLGGAGRDLLRFAAELAEAPVPAGLIADGLLRSGLEPARPEPGGFLARWLARRRPAEPLDAETAQAYVEAGLADLKRLNLAEAESGRVVFQAQAVRLAWAAETDLARRAALRQAALLALFGVAERCAARHDWRPLAPLIVHAHPLVAAWTATSTDHSPSPDRETDPLVLNRLAGLACYLGEFNMAYGAPRAALRAYRSGNIYLAGLAAATPDDLARQRNLAVSYHRLGDVRLTLDDLAGALEEYRRGLALVERLAAEAAAGADWAWEAAVGYERLADFHQQLGAPDAALAELQSAMAGFERLANQDPRSRRFARAFAVVCNKIGELLRLRGDRPAALAHFQRALSIARQLVALEPNTPQWLRDEAHCHNLIGNVLADHGDLAGALAAYRAYHAVAERLAALAPASGDRQRDLEVSYVKLGMTLELAQDWTGALAQYRLAHAIAERLAALAPHNPVVLNDLVWVRQKIEGLTGLAA